jgi:hypothetical protein
MKNQMSPDPNEPVRAEYDAPRAQRLSDAVRARGAQCSGDGNGASEDCINGTGAKACVADGNRAFDGCVSGTGATECANKGNSPD